ncbi:MAG: hypothetical protein JO316_12970 [Abitibacteriaceae bacterium]|nr:hypothetical protein [Abditibacteriaceae bacterium]
MISDLTPQEEQPSVPGWYLLRREGQAKWTLVWSTSPYQKRLGYDIRGPYPNHQTAKAAAYEDGGGLVGDTEYGSGTSPRSPLSG